jgi:hypothetical protein
MHYTIDTERRVIRMRGRGRLTNREMIDCVARLRADDRVTPGMPTLSDMREVTELAITFEGVKAVAEIMANTRDRRGKAKIAILVINTSDAMMAKLMDAASEKDSPGVEFRPFDDPAEAEAWLGLPADSEKE